MTSDPLGSIEWLFASNEQLGINYVPKNKFDTSVYFENKFQIEWKSINSIASYSIVKSPHNKPHHHKHQNSTFTRLALSKYQIHENHLDLRMDSILTIKVNSKMAFKKLKFY